MTYTSAADYADTATEKARMASHHADEGNYFQRYLAEAVEEIAKALAELARADHREEPLQYRSWSTPPTGYGPD
jgi:hypothetical protein